MPFFSTMTHASISRDHMTKSKSPSPPLFSFDLVLSPLPTLNLDAKAPQRPDLMTVSGYSSHMGLILWANQGERALGGLVWLIAI